MTSWRGLFAHPAGLDATRAIHRDRSGASTEFFSGTLRLSLTPDGGFASIEGSGVAPSRNAHRLFDIVIRRKGNADGGVLAWRPS
jgi:hypothetical protein